MTFVISFGQVTTKGSVRNTRLPPAPIDQCSALDASSSFNMTYVTTAMYMMNTSTELGTTVADAYLDVPEM